MGYLIVGCGNMGGALVSGMLRFGHLQNEQISTILPDSSPDIQKIRTTFGINVYTEYPKNEVFEVVVFAVKPQTLPEILPAYSKLIPPNTLIVSIAAGKTIKFFQKYFKEHTIIRAMPNINVLASKGATVAVASKMLNAREKSLVDTLFKSSGSLHFAESEDMMDLVTAISGSGPAYYLNMLQHLTKIAESQGCPSSLAKDLVIETFIGTAKMLEESGKTPAELQAMITSPNGTTHSAITNMNADNKFYKLLEAGINAAKNRAQQLSE